MIVKLSLFFIKNWHVVYNNKMSDSISPIFVLVHRILIHYFHSQNLIFLPRNLLSYEYVLPWQDGLSFFSSFVSNISNLKDQIKSWQNSGHWIYIVTCWPRIIKASKQWICCYKYQTTTIQKCSNTCLGYRNSSLFHCFVSCDLVNRMHLIKLVNYHNNTISSPPPPLFLSR